MNTRWRTANFTGWIVGDAGASLNSRLLVPRRAWCWPVHTAGLSLIVGGERRLTAGCRLTLEGRPMRFDRNTRLYPASILRQRRDSALKLAKEVSGDARAEALGQALQYEQELRRRLEAEQGKGARRGD